MRIILDTDPGIDDALAILYVAAQPEAEIVAAGSVHGNVPAPVGARNALRILEKAGLTEVPVAVGANRPLAQALHTAEFVHGDDGLGGHAGPPPSAEPIGRSAAENLVSLARTHPGELTLLALGPLTNLAVALMLEPELPALLRRVVLMGGALAVPGNITPHAEANFWHDPEAADLVLGAGFPELTMVGLDATNAAVVDGEWLAALEAIPDPRARFASALLAHYQGVHRDIFGRPECILHDPLAAAIMLDPDLASYQRAALGVELRGAHTRGQLIADLRGISDDTNIASAGTVARRPVTVATAVEVPEFLARMLDAFKQPQQQPQQA